MSKPLISLAVSVDGFNSGPDDWSDPLGGCFDTGAVFSQYGTG